MANAVLDKQIIITVNNEVGALAEITGILSSAGINLIAVCAYAVENKGVIMFVTQNTERAKKILKSKKYDVREEEVVILTLENKPGTLAAATKKIAEAGIDLTLIYGSDVKNGKAYRIVLISENNAAVLMALKGK